MFGFLFDLSQEIDRQSASRLFVASVGPPEGSAEVFLGDFRRSTIEELLRAADRDMGRRVGRIESWGAPNVHLRLKWVP